MNWNQTQILMKNLLDCAASFDIYCDGHGGFTFGMDFDQEERTDLNPALHEIFVITGKNPVIWNDFEKRRVMVH